MGDEVEHAFDRLLVIAEHCHHLGRIAVSRSLEKTLLEPFCNEDLRDTAVNGVHALEDAGLDRPRPDQFLSEAGQFVELGGAVALLAPDRIQ